MDVYNVYKQAVKEGFECGISLAKAIQDAGGTIPDAKYYSTWTVEEFITSMAAQNNIRFVYIPREERNGKK